jgi:hypothetical protein
MPAPPASVTVSADAFLRPLFQTSSLFNRTIDLSLRADYIAHVADAAIHHRKRAAETQ